MVNWMQLVYAIYDGNDGVVINLSHLLKVKVSVFI